MKHIFTLSILLVTLVACRQMVELEEEPSTHKGDALVDITIQPSDADGAWNELTRTYELSTTEESKIKLLDILVFNSAGNLVSREKIINPTSNTHRISTPVGTGVGIYVVANATMTVNASGSPIDALGQVTTLVDLQNIKITNILADVTTNRTLVMSGFASNQTIDNGIVNALSLQLNYVAAKVTVNIRSMVPAPSSFDLIDYKLASLARYSYVFPRPTDVVVPTDPADFATQASTNSWKDTVITYSGTPYPVKTTTFYIFENRRGTNSNTLASQKSGATAPLAASKLLARGYFKSPSGVTGMDITLMFGANSINDYNVERTKQYTYNVDVIGISQINIDTRYTESGIGFQADVSNTTLDAHYDFRPLRIMAYPGNSKVTILDELGTPTDPDVGFWLNVSAIDITKFVDNGTGTYVRPRYDPVSLVQETSITHFPTTGMKTEWLYLYAEEYLVDNGVRKATVRVVHTPTGGTPLPPINIEITQRGILLAGNVGMRVTNSAGVPTSTNYKLGTEIIEEATLSITPGNSAAERTMTMQWGFDGTQILPFGAYSLRNGLENTRTLVMSNTSTGALRTPYGRSGATLISHQAYHPIYNTYAARYCFEKNRDTDGDGVIVGPEVKWYLPSVDEQLLIDAGNDSWSANVADRWLASTIYTSSSQYTSTTHLVSIYSNGNTGTTVNSRLENVRCVRQM